MTPVHEAWGGGLMSGGIASAWYGYGYAPRSLLEPDDWRFRTVAGVTTYRATPASLMHTVTTYGDVFAGYQWRHGPLTTKALAGLTATSTTTIDQRLATQSVQTKVGGKVAAEFWLNIGPNAFAKLDSWAASAGPLGAIDVKLGAVVLPYLSIGPEARLFRYDSSRQDTSFGGFARLAWPTGEVTGSAGIMHYDDPTRGSGLYLGLSYFGRY